MREPFDPRQRIELAARDHGPIVVWRPDATGTLTPRAERSVTMDVVIDGALEIVDGLALRASDPLVAFHECGMCGLWECNLVEGAAARVRRFGPYVLWLHPGGRAFTFDAGEYARALGGPIDALPPLSDDDAWDLPDPDDQPTYPGVDGALLAQLREWPRGVPDAAVPVAPPRVALELRALDGRSLSAWVDARPREDGRRAVFLPAVTAARVWCAGPAVDRVVASLSLDAG